MHQETQQNNYINLLNATRLNLSYIFFELTNNLDAEPIEITIIFDFRNHILFAYAVIQHVNSRIWVFFCMYMCVYVCKITGIQGEERDELKLNEHAD